MNSAIVNFIKKRWFLIWMLIACFSMASMIVYAEYASQYSYMKRVVVSEADQGMMFSSNYLIEGGADAYQAKYESVVETKTYDVNVFLWNYSLSNTTQCYDGEIDYTVYLKVTDVKGDPIMDIGTRKITIKESNGTIIKEFDSANFTETLSFTDRISDGQGAQVQNHYIVTFSGWDLEQDDGICLQMVAKPDHDLHKDLRDLGAIIGLKQMSESASSGWKATISELQNSNSDVDGYNLVLTGSGKATIKINWDTNHLDINQYFRVGNVMYSFENGERVVDEPDANGWVTMTINADANQYRNRYSMQVYFLTGEKPNPASFFAEEGSSGAAGAWLTYKITGIE